MKNEDDFNSTEVMPPQVVQSMERAQIDGAIATAKQYPRDLVKVKRDIETMATDDEETAEGCFYVLSRQGKSIEGPSVRLAEIVLACYGNLRGGARQIEDDGKFIRVQGVCHDLEKNVYLAVEVSRRVTDKNSKRYSEDMIATTANAANAIALRNAVLKVVPKAIWNNAYVAAKKVATGDGQTMDVRRQRAIESCKKLGLDEARILNAVGCKHVEEIGVSHLELLFGLVTAVRESQQSIDEAFPKVFSGPKTVVKGTGKGPAMYSKTPTADDHADEDMPAEETEVVGAE